MVGGVSGINRKLAPKKIKHLVVIGGPTASGKTALSVALAQRLSTSVISADSRQFYKELSIGTAKPTEEEMQGVPHHFVDSHFLNDEVSAATFEKLALQKLDELFTRTDFVIVSGGSGMFIDALCVGLDDIPTSRELRDQLSKKLEQKGLEPLLEELKVNDPAFFEVVDRQNPARILRALEVIHLTGKPFSHFRKQTPPPRPFNVHRFVIDHPREILYDRINQRVDIMMKNGLEDEAKSVEHLRGLTSLNTVGYTELFAYFDGDISREEAVEKIKQNTRRYAKRQLTWFRRHEEAHWIPFGDQEVMVKAILDKLPKEILE